MGTRKARKTIPLREPLWFKDAVIYELHIRAFADGNDDGIGDLRGLCTKLDYLSDLGVTAIWLLPFYPSPLRDDGYDIAAYGEVHTDYGTLADFKRLVSMAHERGLKVITEMVLNHTSERHPWFQRSRRAKPGSLHRDFYVWSESPDRYKGTRIIFRDFETSNWTWDPVAKAYYWHRFYSHQPDLNYDHPPVRKAVLEAVDFWFGHGIDGLRLDAVPYLFEREGTSNENLPETHQFLRELRSHVDSKFPNRMLLAEANQWPEDAVAYFGEGDECHMAFQFPVMPRLFMAVRMEDRHPIVDIVQQTPAIPETCQWAVFLRNHDELTLEMVTDEERDYMYRVYASDPRARINLGIRRRLAPLLGNDRRRIELLNGLLLSFPGTPVLYYGDEIGMGDNIYLGDRNGVRTPMQWNADRNAGFSRANAQSLYLPVIIDPDYHYERLNVETQQRNPHSLLWWTRRLLALRRQHKAFGRGTVEFLLPSNRKILAFIRQYEGEQILVVANLSRFVQHTQLDLSARRGMTPVEMFGGTDFPRIESGSYPMMLGPHSFYWFELRRVEEGVPAGTGEGAGEPALRTAGGWVDLFHDPAGSGLNRALGEHLRSQRWFRGKARRLKRTAVVEKITIPRPGSTIQLAILQADYTEGESESYLLPLTLVTEETGRQMRQDRPGDIVAAVTARGETGFLANALAVPEAIENLFDLIDRKRRIKGLGGEVLGVRSAGYRRIRGSGDLPAPVPSSAEQSNSSVLLGNRMILKLYRSIEAGVNPELELGLFLTEKARFDHAVPVAGWLEYRSREGGSMSLGVLQAYVANEGDAWSYTLDSVDRFLEKVLSLEGHREPPDPPGSGLVKAALVDPSRDAIEWIGFYADDVRLLGRRTAELHLALAGETEDPSLAPEPFTLFYQRSLFQSMRNQLDRALGTLRQKIGDLGAEEATIAQRVVQAEGTLLRRFERIRSTPLSGQRIRIHGDYHLGQVLRAGRDFVLIDFEGEPAHSLSARRIKRSPLRDVAGMLRSFDYAAQSGRRKAAELGLIPRGSEEAVRRWTRFWAGWAGAAFLGAYLEAARKGEILPTRTEEIEVVLDCLLLEKLLYELQYELNTRPAWVGIPLASLADLLDLLP